MLIQYLGEKTHLVLYMRIQFHLGKIFKNHFLSSKIRCNYDTKVDELWDFYVTLLLNILIKSCIKIDERWINRIDMVDKKIMQILWVYFIVKD